MANIILATPILSDAASLTASSAPASLPVENLQRMSVGQVWRNLNPSGCYIVADLGSDKAVNFVGLIAHNASSRGFVRVRAASVLGDIESSPDYDSGNLPMRSHQSGYDASWASGVSDEEYGALDLNSFLLSISEQSLRYWRFDITDEEISYLDIGRLYISKAWTPSTNIDYGVRDGFIDPSLVERTYGGRNAVVDRPKYRYSEFHLAFGTKEEMYDEAFEIDRLRGQSKDVLFINDIEDKDRLQKRTIYGLLKESQPIENTQFSIFEKSYRIEEISE